MSETTVQEEVFRHWCDTWAPGTYDRLTEAQRQALRERLSAQSEARRRVLRFQEDLQALYGKIDWEEG